VRVIFAQHNRGFSPAYDKPIQRLGGVSPIAAHSPMDSFGKARVPRLERLPRYDGVPDGGWVISVRVTLESCPGSLGRCLMGTARRVGHLVSI